MMVLPALRTVPAVLLLVGQASPKARPLLLSAQQGAQPPADETVHLREGAVVGVLIDPCRARPNPAGLSAYSALPSEHPAPRT
jgi:hypothetical protein